MNLKRWTAVSIKRKLYAVMGTMTVLIACELGTLSFAMHTLSAVRAFVGGEGAWSKAQKNAALALQHYALTGDETGYDTFLAQLRVPEGDHRARVELERPSPDLSVVVAGFRQGHIAADDVRPMVDLLRRFSGVSYLKRAVQRWREADALLVEFKAAGVRYHALRSVGSRDTAVLTAALARINQLNAELTVVEDDFSAALGEGSRWMERVLISLLVLAVLTVESVGLMLTLRISQAITRGLAAANSAAERIGGGDFSTPMAVDAGDEFGRLAESINRMGALLERSYKTLETRVQQRTAELEAMADQNARLYEDARAAVRMRDEFTSIASHELKTPLATLTLQLELLARQIERSPDAAERARLTRSVEVALRQSNRLALLASELMDLTAIRVGRLNVRPEPCDLAAIVRDAALQLGHDAARAGCTLEVDADTPVRGSFDPVRMTQTATNLIANAIKYGNAQPVKVSLRELNGAAVLAVTDRGIGIKPESLAKVFDRFERAPEVGATHPGLGLGLYITRQIVELHGGRIWVESEYGAGSTFTVELPLRASA